MDFYRIFALVNAVPITLIYVHTNIQINWNILEIRIFMFSIEVNDFKIFRHFLRLFQIWFKRCPMVRGLGRGGAESPNMGNRGLIYRDLTH